MPRIGKQRIIALDTEATGLDAEHGCEPFLVTIYDGEKNLYWEWDVDPFTRKVKYVKEDLQEILEMINRADRIVLQNGKFDIRMLRRVYARYGINFYIPKTKLDDTIILGHLLASNQPHDLTTMVQVYCKINIKPYETTKDQFIELAGAIIKKNNLGWMLGGTACPSMPSSDKTWEKSSDMWILRMLAKLHPNLLPSVMKTPVSPEWEEGDPVEDHPFWTATLDYANVDSESTYLLREAQLKLVKEKNLLPIYKVRIENIDPVIKMEKVGVTYNTKKLNELRSTFLQEAAELEQDLLAIAEKYDYKLELPKGGCNNSLLNFVFGIECLQCSHCKHVNKRKGYYEGAPCNRKLKRNEAPCKGFLKVYKNPLLGVEIFSRSKKTNRPELNAKVIEQLLYILDEGSEALEFLQKLVGLRKRMTAVTYMNSYEKFSKPCTFIDKTEKDFADYKILYPSLNPTGSDTLRFSSSNPNEQNISKKKGFNLRKIFGPAPGREWWSADAQNIELRIPAYESNEEDMIYIFEHPDSPPYYGSNHLMTFDTLWPEIYAIHGKKVKELYESTNYQWSKNGNFAVQYGSIEKSGTADAAYHMKGAFRKIKNRFKKIHGEGGLNEQMIKFAEKHGYVETMIDKSINAQRGYPVYCTRTKYGGILQTVPLNYHTQGTAMWWMIKAMNRCQNYLDTLNRGICKHRDQYFMIMQVHDEIVFDFPAAKSTIIVDGEPAPWMHNFEIMKTIKKLMEEGGNDIGIPTPVSVEYHQTDWSEGVSIAL